MGWFDSVEDRQKLQDLNNEMEEMLGNSNTSPPRKGFNKRAQDLRNDPRDAAKRREAEKVIEEEETALEKGRGRNFDSSESGEELADESIDTPFWRRFL